LDELTGTWDIVAANLDPRALMENADRLACIFNIMLIVSGVPIDQWAAVKGELQAKGLLAQKEIVGAEWASGLFVQHDRL
jgi:ribosomal protein L11 methylase PrmA